MTPAKLFAVTLCLSCCLARNRADAQQADSIPDGRAYKYMSLTLFSGASILLSGTSSTLQVGFPYSITDSAGKVTDTVFQSGKVKSYRSPKVFLLPLAIEMGNLRHFFRGSFTVELIGNWTKGYNASIGYGRNFFVNGPWRHHTMAAEKGLVIKPSIQVAYNLDKGNNHTARIGNIDNTNKTIRAFGKIATPSYSYTEVYDDYSNSTTTYRARLLEVDYRQIEIALMPRISLTGNPFLHQVCWELTVGYNIPLYNKAGIALVQDDGNGNHLTPVGQPLDLNQPGLSVNYNGRPVTKAPYRFSGLYLALSFALCSKHDLIDKKRG